MGCCGTTQATMTELDRLKVRYLGGRPIEVTGPVTGRTYRFSGKASVQLVDPRDAVSIARRQAFRLEGLVKVMGETISERTTEEPPRG